jgi:ketosteroid isomerase-like protein
MKIFLCTFLFASFVFAPSLRAQLAPSRLRKVPPTDIPIEPTPLPKIDATPTPTPAPPEPVASPVATPMVEVSPSISPTATPNPEETVTRKSRPRRARAKGVSTSEATPAVHVEATPAPAPTPRATEEHSWWETRSAASALKALEKQWEAAFNDPAVIEKCVADDFVGTSPAGELMSKKDLLRQAKENPGTPPQTTARDLDVHLQGTELAVVTGAADQLNRNRAGELVLHRFRFTDTWVKRDGTWKCVASQSMLAPR